LRVANQSQRYLRGPYPLLVAQAEFLAIARYSIEEMLSLGVWLIYFCVGVSVIAHAHGKVDIFRMTFIFLIFEVSGALALKFLKIPPELFLWLLLILISVPLLYIILLIGHRLVQRIKTSVFRYL